MKWLNSVNCTYDENHQQLKIEKQANKYNVTIFNKYNDGSIDDSSSGYVEWYLDGKLSRASLGFSNIKDNKNIKIIDSSIKNWYDKLGEKVPPYVIYQLTYWFGEGDPSASVKCKNNDSFQIYLYSGQIISYNNNKSNDNSSSLKSVSNKYKFFGIYAKRVKLAKGYIIFFLLYSIFVGIWSNIF